MNESLLTAAGLGAVSGLRSMQGVAWVSQELAGRRFHFRATRLQRWLAEDTVSVVLAGLAVGEVVADKLPNVPPRIAPGPLLGRAALGAVVGAVAGGREQAIPGAAIGAGAAVLAAFAGWFLRSELSRARMLPDPALALVEDALAVVGARAMARRL